MMNLKLDMKRMEKISLALIPIWNTVTRVRINGEEVSCLPPVAVKMYDYASAGNAVKGLPFFKVWLPQLYNQSRSGAVIRSG